MGKAQISFVITLKSEIIVVYLQRQNKYNYERSRISISGRSKELHSLHHPVPELSGYVLTLQNFDRLIKEGVKDGTIIVSENKIETDKTFDL